MKITNSYSKGFSFGSQPVRCPVPKAPQADLYGYGELIKSLRSVLSTGKNGQEIKPFKIIHSPAISLEDIQDLGKNVQGEEFFLLM